MSTLKNLVQRAAKVGTQAALQAVAVAEQVARLSREVFEQFTGGGGEQSPQSQVTTPSRPPTERRESPHTAASSTPREATRAASSATPAPARRTTQGKARSQAAAKHTPVPGAPPVPSRWRLEKMRKQELLELCQAHKLDCRPEMRKRELVELLSELAPRRRKYRMSGGPLPSPVTLLKRPRSYLERLCAEHNVECPPDERKRFIINRLYEKVTGAPPDWERFGEPAHPSR